MLFVCSSQRICRGACLETIDTFMTVLNYERAKQPRIIPNYGPPYFATAGWESRLSLKSPGGHPGSLGKNIPTLC